MMPMPLWGVATAAASPALLVTGWTIAARLQPGGFDSTSQTISALAALDAAHRWVMTAAIIGTGAAQIATAVALRPAARPGRVVMGVGGVCTVLVGLLPLPGGAEGSTAHTVVAAGSFGALALWPLASWRRSSAVPWTLRPGVAVTAGCVLSVTTAWFFRDALTDGTNVGLSERANALLVNLWPVVVAVSALESRTLRDASVAAC